MSTRVNIKGKCPTVPLFRSNECVLLMMLCGDVHLASSVVSPQAVPHPQPQHEGVCPATDTPTQVHSSRCRRQGCFNGTRVTVTL